MRQLTSSGEMIFKMPPETHLLIYLRNRFTDAKPLLNSSNSLNIYELSIYQTLLFMHKVKNTKVPTACKIILQKQEIKQNITTPIVKTKYIIRHFLRRRTTSVKLSSTNIFAKCIFCHLQSKNQRMLRKT